MNKAFEKTGNAAAAARPEEGDPDDTFIDLYVADVAVPMIGRSLLGDEGIHVCNADHDLHVAIGSAFGDFNLIQIARGVVVDRGPEEVAKIASTAAGCDLWRILP